MRGTIVFVRALALVIACDATSARAHGGIPRAWGIVFEPGNEQHVVLRSDLWGLFRTQDGGQSWQWLCAEAYGGDSLSPQRRTLAVLQGGAIVVASAFEGLQVTGTSGVCDFGEMPQFSNEFVQDVVLTAGDEPRLHVLTSTGGSAGVTTRLWESSDGGQSFETTKAVLPLNFSATNVLFAPSWPQRIYVSGKTVADPSNGRLYRSDDQGQTWMELVVPVADDLPWSARLYAVGAHDPDLVFLHKDRAEDGAVGSQPDELWVSSDAGQTFDRIFEAVGDLPGFALSPDGATLLVGGPEEGGLYRAEVQSALTEGQAAFTRVFEGKVWGLRWTSSGVYAGHDDFAGGAAPRFTLGVSLDAGMTFSPLMSICDATFVQCSGLSLTGAACEPLFSGPGGFEQDYLQSERCAAAVQPAATDAGLTGPDGEAGSFAAPSDAGEPDDAQAAEASAPGGDTNPVNADGGGEAQAPRAGCSVAPPSGNAARAVTVFATFATLAQLRRRSRPSGSRQSGSNGTRPAIGVTQPRTT